MDQLTNQEITELVERLGQHPEVRVAQLEQRIRELEGDLVEAQCERDYFKNEAVEARQRIAKAREILQDEYKNEGQPLWMKEALDALEGK